MNKRGALTKIVGLTSVMVGVAMLLHGCSQEANVYATNPVPSDTSTNGGSSAAGNGNVDATGGNVGTSTGNIGASTGNVGASGGGSMSATDMFDLACNKLAAMSVTGVDAEIAVFCSGGKGTTEMKSLVTTAFTGTGTPSFPPIVPISSDPTTSITVAMLAGADKFALGLAAVDAKRDAVHVMTVKTSDVTITNKVLSTTPAVDTTHLECYELEQDITTSIGVKMDSVQNECWIRLSTTPAILFGYRILTPGNATNQPNTSNEQVTFMIETAAASTYVLEVYHIGVNNMGMSTIAESLIKEQPPNVAKTYYSTITGQ